MYNCTANPEIAVIILNWNQALDTIACAQKVQVWDCRPAVILVDNNSFGDDVNLMNQEVLGSTVIALKTNKGFAGANNLGLKQVMEDSFDYVLLLNNDAAIDEVDLQHLVRIMENNAEIGVIGPSVFDIVDDVIDNVSVGGYSPAHYINTRIYCKDQSAPASAKLQVVDYVPGTAALLRCSVLEAIGVFDEQYFFSGEMADLCERVSQAGFKCCIASDYEALHYVDKKEGLRSNLYTYYNLRNRWLYAKKFYPRQRAYWVKVYIKLLVGSLMRMQFRRARMIWLAATHAIFGRFGNQNAYFGH